MVSGSPRLPCAMHLIRAFVIVALSWAPAQSQELPLEFLGQAEAAELRRERPLVFNPEDGHNFRKDYEHKNGYRGERLIAKLGGGGSAPPLAIYDAALFQSTTAHPVTSRNTPTIVTFRPPNSPSLVRETKKHKTEEKTTTTAPTKRKYFNLTRFKKNRVLGKSFLKSSKSEDSEVTPTPSGNDAVVQKRLYRAIWNHGLKGVTETDADKVSDSLKTLEAFAPPNFNSLDLMQQIADAMNGKLEQPSESLSVPELQEPQPTQVPSTEDAPLPQTAGTTVDLQPNEEAVFTGGTPSLDTFAGPGEPSLLVASYSYSEPLYLGGGYYADGTARNAGDIVVEAQPTPESPAPSANDPLTGASEIHPIVVKP